MTHTTMEYLYRDYSNYKAWGSILLKGRLSVAEFDELVGCMDRGLNFVAERVSIPALYDQLWRYSDGPNEDDHPFHEFHTFRHPTADELESVPVWGTGGDLLRRFRECKNNWLTLHTLPRHIRASVSIDEYSGFKIVAVGTQAGRCEDLNKKH